jgi:hypothetical protein
MWTMKVGPHVDSIKIVGSHVDSIKIIVARKFVSGNFEIVSRSK